MALLRHQAPLELAGRSAFESVGSPRGFDSNGLPSLAIDPFPPAGIVGGRFDFSAGLIPSREDSFPTEPQQPRPISPASVEKVASMMRSLAFTATAPEADSDDNQRREWANVSRALMRDVRSEPLARLRTRYPALGDRAQSVLAFACGAMLGVEVPDGALGAVAEELGQLRHHLTPAQFPGSYYEEIFESDLSQLSAACAARKQVVTRRRAAERDVWAALGAPVHSVPELDGAAAQADAAGLVAPGIGARAVSAVTVRAAVREAALTAAEGQVAQLRAELASVTKRLRDAEEGLAASAQARAALERSVREGREAAEAEAGARKAAEAEAARAGASAREEANKRWAVERELAAETAAKGELQAAISRAEHEQASLLAELSAARAQHASALEEERAAHLESERGRADAQARLQAEEAARARLEGEVEAARAEHGSAAAQLAEARAALEAERTARREAEHKAFVEGGLKLRAHETITELRAALQAEQGRLTVANEALLRNTQQLNEAEEALHASLADRADERDRLRGAEREVAAERERAIGEKEARAEAARAADASSLRLQQQLYDVQAQLTEARRRQQDAEAARAQAEARLRAALEQPRPLLPGAADERTAAGAAGGTAEAVGAAKGAGVAAVNSRPEQAQQSQQSLATQLASLSERLRQEAARRQQLERMALDLQAELAAAKAAAPSAERRADFAKAAGANTPRHHGAASGEIATGATGRTPAGAPAGGCGGARASPAHAWDDASDVAPRPPPALMAVRRPATNSHAPSAAVPGVGLGGGLGYGGGAAVGKAGNVRQHARPPHNYPAERTPAPLSGAGHAVGYASAAEADDDDLWSFASGAVARSGGGGCGSTGGGAPGLSSRRFVGSEMGSSAQAPHTTLPRIGSPYSCATRSSFHRPA